MNINDIISHHKRFLLIWTYRNTVGLVEWWTRLLDDLWIEVVSILHTVDRSAVFVWWSPDLIGLKGKRENINKR